MGGWCHEGFKVAENQDWTKCIQNREEWRTVEKVKTFKE
jgi:hypothetical protein